jgi:hypothetical protein
MSMEIVYDKDGSKVPSREFLSTIIILLRKCEVEVDMPLLHFLESFEEENPDWNPDGDVDAYDDKQLKSAISKYMNKMYPPKQ